MKRWSGLILAMLLGGCASQSLPLGEPFEPLTQLTAKGDNWVVLVEKDQLILHSPKHFNGTPVTRAMRFEQESDGMKQVFHTHMPKIRLPVSLTLTRSPCRTLDGENWPYSATLVIMGVFNKDGCAMSGLQPVPTMQEIHP